MADITPPYDFPPADPVGQQIERILSLFRMWLRLHPQWLPLIEKLMRLAVRR